MEMDFNYDSVNALSNALGLRIELLEQLIESNGLSKDVINVISESDYRKDFLTLYGFHIDSDESDPFEAVTYLADAVGMKPAHMNYSTGKFNYGSWEDAFFMPRPCMLKYDGTVDYYLDPNDYSKKEDGTASDVLDFEYAGNAMMEWGRDGKKIWYKIVPDEDDNTSASIYFSEYKLDEGFHAWSFINNQGELVDHFYTPIYNGTLDTNGKLRSISGKENMDLCQNKTVQQEIEAAELNNPEDDKLWYTETYADVTLINLLLVLIGKCLDTQLVFGTGNISKAQGTSYLIGSGTMDDKGLFFGTDDGVSGVKVFGMENYWGNQYRRIAGLIADHRALKYKLTKGMQDGSSALDYNSTGENYIDSGITFSNNQYGVISAHSFFDNGAMLFRKLTMASYRFYYSDVAINYDFSAFTYADRGGDCVSGNSGGAFMIMMSGDATVKNWNTNAAPSCKPLAKSN